MTGRCCATILLTALGMATSPALCAGGIRSLVALPVEPGGTVLRLQSLYNDSNDIFALRLNGAYGLGPRQTLLFGLPYFAGGGIRDDLGDLSLAYRHTIIQNDLLYGTRRLAFLGGVEIPTDSHRDPRLQFGLVATIYQNRSEWDFDAVWFTGLDNAPDGARYDVSWQYRLSPATYPDWGYPVEWDVVFEYGGRYMQGFRTLHQVTAGLLRIERRWVIEGAVVQDLNGPESTTLLVGVRVHF